MQTFESGGALLVRPHATLRAALTALGLIAASVALTPLLGVYLLIVA